LEPDRAGTTSTREERGCITESLSAWALSLITALKHVILLNFQPTLTPKKTSFESLLKNQAPLVGRAQQT